MDAAKSDIAIGLHQENAFDPNAGLYLVRATDASRWLWRTMAAYLVKHPDTWDQDLLVSRYLPTHPVSSLISSVISPPNAPPNSPFHLPTHLPFHETGLSAAASFSARLPQQPSGLPVDSHQRLVDLNGYING